MVDTIAYLELELAKEQPQQEDTEDNQVGKSWDAQAWNEIHAEVDRDEDGGD